MREPRISLPQKDIYIFCNNYHINKLSLFGSVLTDDFGKTSDIDFLVQYDKNNIPTLIGMAHMESELTDIIGRKADLRTAEDLSPYFRDQVIKEAYLVYER